MDQDTTTRPEGDRSTDHRITAVEERADRLGRMVAELVARAVNRDELNVDDSVRTFLDQHGYEVSEDLYAWPKQ